MQQPSGSWSAGSSRASVPPLRVLEAEEAREALRLFRDAKPDIVFLDLVLNGIQGGEVGELILAEHPDANLVLMTALDPRDQRVRFLVSKGAKGVLEKPLDPNEVREMVSEIVGSSAGLGRVVATDGKAHG